MTLILCLGSGNLNADKQAKIFAIKNQLTYLGLLDHENVENSGCYHTSIIDLPRSTIRDLVDKFDKVVLLDQSVNEYETPNDFYQTIELANDIKHLVDVVFLDPKMDFVTITALSENRSLCVMPFVGYYKSGNNVAPCCYFHPKLSITDDKNFDFISNPAFQEIRRQVMAGELVSGCEYCYSVESDGVSSPRQISSKEWMIKLGMNAMNDLQPQERVYNLRVGNKCNLMCRMCMPENSNLIDREYFQIKIVNHQYGTEILDDFGTVNLATVKQLYVAGGEPTISSQFVTFLNRCVDHGQTNFDVIINTNAVSLNKEFLSAVERFKNVKFEISLDGFDRVNQYIRWPARWDKVTNNIKTLNAISQGKISFNTVASIYSVGNLYDCISYLDQNYPLAMKHLAYADSPENQQPWKFPDKDLALADLERINSLICYHNQPDFRSQVSGLEFRIKNHVPNKDEIREFFKWNDLLDKSRGIMLKDYIPILEQCRPND